VWHVKWLSRVQSIVKHEVRWIETSKENEQQWNHVRQRKIFEQRDDRTLPLFVRLYFLSSSQLRRWISFERMYVDHLFQSYACHRHRLVIKNECQVYWKPYWKSSVSIRRHTNGIVLNKNYLTNVRHFVRYYPNEKCTSCVSFSFCFRCWRICSSWWLQYILCSCMAIEQWRYTINNPREISLWTYWQEDVNSFGKWTWTNIERIDSDYVSYVCTHSFVFMYIS
jgi:hypothetical protein